MKKLYADFHTGDVLTIKNTPRPNSQDVIAVIARSSDGWALSIHSHAVSHNFNVLEDCTIERLIEVEGWEDRVGKGHLPYGGGGEYLCGRHFGRTTDYSDVVSAFSDILKKDLLGKNYVVVFQKYHARH
jgi:hypothetical protein